MRQLASRYGFVTGSAPTERAAGSPVEPELRQLPPIKPRRATKRTRGARKGAWGCNRPLCTGSRSSVVFEMTALPGRAHTGAIVRFPSTIGASPVDSQVTVSAWEVTSVQLRLEPTSLRLTAEWLVLASHCKHKYLHARKADYRVNWGGLWGDPTAPLPNCDCHSGLAGHAANLHNNRNSVACLNAARNLHVDLHHASNLARSAASILRFHGLPTDGHADRKTRLGQRNRSGFAIYAARGCLTLTSCVQ